MAQSRHKRDANARLFPRKFPRAAVVAAPVAVLATVSAVTLGLVTQSDPAGNAPMANAPAVVDLSDRDVVSRSSDRQADLEQQALQAEAREAAARTEAAAERKAQKRAQERAEKKARQKAAAAKAKAATAAAVADATEKRWASTDLNLWSAAADDAEARGVLAEGTKVLVTGRTDNGRTEIVLKGKSRWVTTGYLSDEKPGADPVTGPSAGEGPGTLGTTCSNGTSIPSGLDPSLSKVHAAVCAHWPQITDYGTVRSDGEHGQGRAIDVMVSGELGWEIAEHLRDNASALGIEYMIYGQKIWSVERGGEGWRSMPDRGSGTANHFDHIHVTVW